MGLDIQQNLSKKLDKFIEIFEKTVSIEQRKILADIIKCIIQAKRDIYLKPTKTPKL